MNYLPKKVYGLPKGSKDGTNTRKGVPRHHIYTVNIYGSKYFKVHLKRNNKSKIKYFKTKMAALVFLDSLRINTYI